mgnify:CR=1 FL=1|tara:strand:+ start:7818 stop:8396 length:579 start_codon:yes stop_codon:yes gene_type:complete
MLYIKFDIQDTSKYEDFQKLHEHMVNVRQPGFKFVENDPVIDWDSMQTQEEVDAAVKELSDYLDQEPEAHRCKELIPDYVAVLLDKYIQADNEKLESLGIQNLLSVFNYLEYGFEVDLDNLEKINERSGVVEFSTGNYPFGGIERFLITLRAFDLIPTECFDGFNICEFDWLSDFEYNTINLPEKTKAYLNN